MGEEDGSGNLAKSWNGSGPGIHHGWDVSMGTNHV